MQHPFKSVALIGNAKDERVAECMLALTRHLGARALRPLVDSRQPPIFPADAVVQCPERAFATRADLIISIGGDGTLLYAASLVAEHAVPLLGINRGRLGFLTDVGPASMLEDVDSVLDGRYSRDLRSLISARLQREGAPTVRALALNDVVINKRDTGRMMEFETAINGRYVNSHGGDGLVIATATGSVTALQFGFQNDPDYFGLDDVSVTPVAQANFKATVKSTNSFQLSFNTTTGLVYQVQYKTNLLQADWINLGSATSAKTNTLAVTDTNAFKSSSWRFYRLLVVP